MKKEYENYIELYGELKNVRAENESRWNDISRYLGIQIDTQYLYSEKSHSASDPLDEDIYDPTAALAVTQSGDYLDGIIWGTGQKALTLEPSELILQQADKAIIKDYYEFRTKQLLNNMNHSSAGFSAARKPYFYGQTSFGTSGIGVFKNGDFPSKEENPYFFRSFGVDNMVIGEGKNGLIDITFLVYHWKVTQIMQEFDYDEKVIPDEIVKLYKKGDYNQTFTVIQGVIPRQDYQRGLKGKKGTKYKGIWFLDKSKDVFLEEDFRCRPVNVCRAIKIQGEVWGRSAGTMLISTIKAVNFMVSEAIETMAKMNDPALGTYNNALFGDSVIDTGAGQMAVFNEAMQANKGQSPVFKISDVGDPTGLVSWLIPYLNEKVATGFKIDLLLDFASAKDMTATESMQRYAIRGKSLAGLLGQQISEMVEGTVDRCIQIEDDLGLAGVDPTDLEQVKAKADINRSDMVIPEAVLEAMKSGKKWYKIVYNNELERLTKTETLERVMQLINGITVLLSLYPQLSAAIQWYDLFNDLNECLGVSYIKTPKEFRKAIEEAAEMQRKQMLLQAANSAADTGNKVSVANKNQAEAQNQ